jgi:hypothetical protein
MKQLWVNKSPNHNPTCADLMKMAEQELAAFLSAVTELFGSEQARLSAEDWLQELALNRLPASKREWRLISVNVSSRLASRVNASSISTASRTLAHAS